MVLLQIAQLVLGLVVAISAGSRAIAQVQPLTATFRSGVDLVTVNAVVRDRRGRLVTDLLRGDFEVLDGGLSRPISDFRSTETPVHIALLFDESGSMDVGTKRADSRAAVGHVLSWLHSGKDEVALFAFDKKLSEMYPFTTDMGEVEKALERLQPFGVTSLHDAIAESAKRLVEHGGPRRAVVVLTDGIDNNSRLRPQEVSAIASAIDVPVYVIEIVSPLDHPGARTAVGSASTAGAEGPLSNVATLTGGQLFVVSAPAHASVAARQIVTELRHQYLLAFEPSGRPGWHPLVVRTRQKDLTVQARSGYMAGQARPAS
jgi:Ca-activated chloride channel family protein